MSGPNANLINNRGNNYVASILNNDEMLSVGDPDGLVGGHELANGGIAPHRYGKSSGMRRNVDGRPLNDNDLDANADDDYQSMPDDRDSQNLSRLEHVRGGPDAQNGSIPSADMPDSSSRNQGGLIQGNHHSGGMVDSYEIYGENHADDSELDMEEEIISYSNKRRGGGMQTAAGNRGGRGDDIMISGEQIIEPSKMTKADYDGRRRRTSSSKGQRRISQKRESSGVKKTNIEVLDHETPIEEYQQYYQEQQDSNNELHQRQMMPIQHPQPMQQQLEPIDLNAGNQ